MKVLALAKHVPDSTAKIKVKEDGSGIESAGVKCVMNPFCEFAVEAALQLREKNPGADVKVTALTVGNAKAVETLRTAYAMGSDAAVHLCDDQFVDIDEMTTARVIAAAIKDEGYDLVLAGKVAIDYDSGQLGPALAECLDWPHVSAVTDIEWGADFKSATVRRRVEGAEEVVEVQLPCLLTCEKGLCEPRYPSLPLLMRAKKKPVDTKDAATLGLSTEDLSRDTSATRMGEFAPPPPRPSGRKLEGEPEEVAKELANILRNEEKLI